MDDLRTPTPPVGPFDPEAWARWMKDVMGMRNAAERPAVGAHSSILARQSLETFDLARPAHQLSRVFPDLEALSSFVRASGQSLERRARVLEVVILRGVHPQWSCDVMVSLLGGLMLIDQPVRRETEEKVGYQREAVELVVESGPELFAQLSQRTDRLPVSMGGRHPATEWMKTNLQDGGLLAGDFQRNTVFAAWLEGLPARDRGRAIFHLGDAAGAQERTATFGLSWAIADSHWLRVTRGVLAQVERGLGYSYEAGLDPAKVKDREDFYHGYVLASRTLDADIER